MATAALPETDGRRIRGARTREAILEAAATLASVVGLEGLSLGTLATHLGMSKSGLYAHFASKEDLQVAAIRAADAMYLRDVGVPAQAAPPGRARLLAFVDTFLDYVRDGPFPGGCFFIASYMDHARLRAPVRSELARVQQELFEFLSESARDAQALGELAEDLDPDAIAFELDALLVGTDVNFVLFGDPSYLERGRRAARRMLGVVEGRRDPVTR